MRVLLMASIVAAASFAGAGAAVAQSGASEAKASRAPTDVSSQRQRPQRASTRIRVRPLPHWWEYHRQCSFQLVQEVRASGTYVVPREHCRWEPFPPP